MGRYKELEEIKLFSYHLSWIEFNERVLKEGIDCSNPLLERAKYLAIVQNNLDEFFMIKISKLLREKKNKEHNKNILIMLESRTKEQTYCAYNCFKRIIIPALIKEKIIMVDRFNIEYREQEYLKKYFKKFIYPILSPIILDEKNPFPNIYDKAVNLIFRIKDKNKKNYVVLITIPKGLPRVIEIPGSSEENKFILLEELIKMNINFYFHKNHIADIYTFRIIKACIKEKTRLKRYEMSINVSDNTTEKAIKIEVDNGIDEGLIKILKEGLEIKNKFIFKIPGYLDLNFLNDIYEMRDKKHLKYPVFNPYNRNEFNKYIFSELNKKDILLHYPFDSFAGVTNFLYQAAIDSKVIAIKQTIYRTERDSKVIQALELAAQNGKEVTVVIEIKARFEEARNLIWAKRLMDAGCNVVYGVSGFKTHCKMLLIIRKEKNGLKRYINISTGNYNSKTANIYTDLSLFSADPYISEDVCNIFNFITGGSCKRKLYKIDMAPLNMRDRLIFLINQEMKNVEKGEEGKILAKMNGLTDEKLIDKLYEASEKGVSITLIVRGICTLIPRNNIQVKSVVGRFLEHSRAFYFYSRGEEKVYISSADWMRRNLDNRVEVMVPIESCEIKENIKDMLKIYIEDDTKSSILQKNGKYIRANNKFNINVQQQFIDYKNLEGILSNKIQSTT